MDYTCCNCGTAIPVHSSGPQRGLPKSGIAGGELEDGELACSRECEDDYLEHDGVPVAERTKAGD